jgi:pimeloyl-ACP methyl ester carboxylesterase
MSDESTQSESRYPRKKLVRVKRSVLEMRRWPTSRRVDYVLDQVHYITALIAGKRYFRNDPCEEFEYRDFSEILRQHPPTIHDETETGWRTAINVEGTERNARVHWRRPPEPGRPVLVYHHGAGSIPHDKVFNRIVPKGVLEHWNLASIQAPAHRSLKDFFTNGFDSLFHIQLMLAASTQAFESISRWAVLHGAPYVAYCGVSLGGIICTLHMCHYGSANLYLPMLSGMDVHHLVLEGSSKSLTDRAELRSRFECYKKALDFTPLLAAAPRRPCFPLLAKHDVMMDYRRALRAWKGYPIRTIERGHSTGVVTYQAFTEHLLTHLPQF